MESALEMKHRVQGKYGWEIYSLDGPENPEGNLEISVSRIPAFLACEPNKIWLGDHNQSTECNESRSENASEI